MSQQLSFWGAKFLSKLNINRNTQPCSFILLLRTFKQYPIENSLASPKIEPRDATTHWTKDIKPSYDLNSYSHFLLSPYTFLNSGVTKFKILFTAHTILLLVSLHLLMPYTIQVQIAFFKTEQTFQNNFTKTVHGIINRKITHYFWVRP